MSTPYDYYNGILDSLLQAYTDIPRFEEPGRVSKDGSLVSFGWGNWTNTSSPDTGLVVDGIDVDPSTYVIDAPNGRVTLNTPISTGIEVRANYTFDLVTDSQYPPFIDLILSHINGKKPQTFYTIESVPSTWTRMLVLGAYEYITKMLITKMQMFKWRRLFENPDGLIATLTAFSSDAKQEFTDMLPTIKRRGEVQACAVASYNLNVPQQITEVNFKSYTILRS
jgi:hypothetical protein